MMAFLLHPTHGSKALCKGFDTNGIALVWSGDLF